MYSKAEVLKKSKELIICEDQPDTVLMEERLNTLEESHVNFQKKKRNCWGTAASFPLAASEVILHLRNLRRLKRRRISFIGKC